MNILDILKSIEQAIYEIALWIVLIPKTVFLILTRPMKMADYVGAELEKEEKKQFSDQMSPILLWLLLVIVPAYLLVKFYLPGIPAYLTKNPQNYFFYITVTFISFILIPALMMNMISKKAFDRESFKESFYVQCYLQAPISFLGVMLIGLMKYLHYNFDAFNKENYTFLFNDVNGWKDILALLLYGLLLLLGIQEVRLTMKKGKSIGAAIGLMVLCFFAIGFAMCITGAFGYILFYGL